MKSAWFVVVALISLMPWSAFSAERLIPAGSLIECTVNEPKLSSKTTSVGDPLLCEAEYSSRYGGTVLPFDSFLIGHFEDYKDPGHFVGKGWMELKFDRMLIEPDTVIPIHAKVVNVSGYDVDREGRILGKGHAVRDTLAWTVPILWPIDVINLPRRGPRPTLHAETRLTLKVMDDLGVPVTPAPQPDSNGLYRREPSAYRPNVESSQPTPSAVPLYAEQMRPVPDALYRSSPVRLTGSVFDSHRMPYVGPNTPTDAEMPQAITVVFKDGRPPVRVYNYVLTPSTLYVLDGYRFAVPLQSIDIGATDQVNRQAGVDFHLPLSSQ